jgi:thiamine biosynthesis lipoprotein
MSATLNRRRVILIAGAAAGLGALPFTTRAATRTAQNKPPLYRWRGAALGAQAEIVLAHPDKRQAERIIAACLAEIDRLEDVFSLYRPSALTALNQAGVLRNPPAELVEVLSQARLVSKASAGAFDVTVQPLWTLYANVFTAPGDHHDGPPAAMLAGARAHVDYRALHIEPGEIRFTRPGMAATLNGIAQGFITDRVAELLRAEGLSDILLELGETRALGRHPQGRPWRAGIAAPQAPDTTVRTIDLTDRALATSGGYGAPFDAAGRYHHLFDPTTGQAAHHYRSVSILAPTATLADALSTALYVLPPERAAASLAAFDDVGGFFILEDGSTKAINFT